MDVLKQSVGIDIAKKTFTACVCKRYRDMDEELSEVREFGNDKTGYNRFLKWVGKKVEKKVEIFYAMEATGIYYENLACHLNKLKKNISVLLPNKVSHYGKSLNIKTKTDEVDAKIIAMMACERKFFPWTPPTDLFKRLRSICRLYKTLQGDKIRASNRLKQLECSYEPLREAIKIHKSTVRRLEKQLSEVENLMETTLKSDDKIWSKVKNLLSIKGIGLKTIAIILGETQGFALIKNQRQLTSYSGYDVVKRESGTSIKGKTRISKKGNGYIRSAMYFPSMAAIRFNPKMRELYERIMKTRTVKKIGLVAVQRKLLVLMYTLWKTDMPFVDNYKKKEISGFQEEEVSSSSSTRRVEKEVIKEKVDGAQRLPSTQNEHLYDQSSEVLLRQKQISEII